MMVGTDGYAPSTPRMSIEYSTIELSSLLLSMPRYPKAIQISKLIGKILLFWVCSNS
jgi:hypothetical protein